GGPKLRPEEGAGVSSCALVESADPRAAPLPACGERSDRILRCDPGDSPSARSAENPPHPSPLPASGERELTSALVGIDGAAPIRCTQIEAAALARPSASGSGVPCASCAASAPTKQSPAPVVSTAFTARPGTMSGAPSTRASAPRLPRVTQTVWS